MTLTHNIRFIFSAETDLKNIGRSLPSEKMKTERGQIMYICSE